MKKTIALLVFTLAVTFASHAQTTQNRDSVPAGTMRKDTTHRQMMKKPMQKKKPMNRRSDTTMADTAMRRQR